MMASAKWAHDSLEVLTLALQNELFAIEAASVLEILDLPQITEVPNASPFLNGLINVRGRVVPLADLRVKFDMPQQPPTPDTRIIVADIDLDGEMTTVGLLADKVLEVTEIAAATLEETPTLGMRWRPDYIRCICKRDRDFIAVLNFGTIFANASKSGQDSGPIGPQTALPAA